MTQAWAIQDYAHGERLLAEACKAHPDHWHLRTCHAAAIAYCSRFTSARKAFDSLLADTPVGKEVHMHGLLGIEWCRIGRHDLAVPLLQFAVKAPEAPAPVYESLANALDHVRNPEEANAILDQGLALYAGHPGLILVRSRLQRQAGEFNRAEASAREILANPLSSPEVGAMAGHELGHALDAQGRYAEAFAAYSSAKKSRYAQLAPYRSIWEQGIRRVKQLPVPNAGVLAQWRDEARSTTTDPQPRLAMLVGCPRSGTTLLERVIDSHPEVISASETTIFNNLWSTRLRAMAGVTGIGAAIRTLSDDDVLQMRRSYHNQMEDALEQPVGDRLLLDKNPSSLTQLPVILRTFPDVKILMALRDPRAIAWSCFTQYLPDNSDSVAFNALDTTAAHVSAQLGFWLRMRAALPSGIWHETAYERMVGDFETESRNVLSFLGLAWDPCVADFHANPSPVRSPTYAEAARPVYSHAVEKWRHYEEFMSGAFDELKPITAKLFRQTEA